MQQADRDYYFYNKDPQSITPDAYRLLEFYDSYFFQKQLEACELKWSKKMTLCAGTCKHSSDNSCTITLSQSLLQYRNSNELKETLLHEMIHAFLFLTNPMACLSDGGHGVEFQKIMHFINDVTGLNDEVDSFRIHIWKCNGKCAQIPPFFGICKRAMNRPPQIHDKWFLPHRQTCGGIFIKIDGPEFKNKGLKTNKAENKSSLDTQNKEDEKKDTNKVKNKKQSRFNDKERYSNQQTSMDSFLISQDTNQSQSQSKRTEMSQDATSISQQIQTYENWSQMSQDIYNLDSYKYEKKYDNKRQNEQVTQFTPSTQSNSQEIVDIIDSRIIESNEQVTQELVETKEGSKCVVQIKIYLGYHREQHYNKQEYFIYLLNGQLSIIEISQLLSKLYQIDHSALKYVIHECQIADIKLQDIQNIKLYELSSQFILLFDYGQIKINIKELKRINIDHNSSKNLTQAIKLPVLQQHIQLQ